MILITATGRDKPGMVAALSARLFELQCNIEDATMTRLSGEFAMILAVAPPGEVSTHELIEALAPLRASHGLRIHCNDVEDNEAEARERSTPPTSPRLMLSAYGADKTGLVARMAGVLATHGVNITDLQTRVTSNHTVYVMLFEIELSPNVSEATLRAALDEASRELDIEYSLHAIDEDAL
jgi:glycine cleavage system transcriptional repressor